MIFKSLTSLVFLPRCVGCENWIDQKEEPICSDCFTRLHFLQTPAFLPLLSKLYFEKTYSVLAYEGLVHDWIHQYKYHKKFYLVPWLGELLSRPRLDWNSYDALVPVPLHWMRHLRRGFNPSHLLADRLGKKIGKPVVHFLKRKRRTPAQATLDSVARLKNVKGAFVFRHGKKTGIRNASLLLVDDVLTTGATVNECAKVLKKAGAKKVDVLTLARPL